MSKEIATIPQPVRQIATVGRGVQFEGGGTPYDDTELRQRIGALEEGKEDKVSGKGLSTEDFTTAEKNKLSNLSNYDDTQIKSDLNNKVDKVANKHLSSNDYTDNEKNKLAGLFNYDDTSISNRVSAIEGKIPSQATNENQLADKAFVNSSIATATATFRGTFNSLADLQAYSGEHDDNDYAFVIDTDSLGNTLYKRYKFTSNQWLFEYTLNNSSFTAEQWSTINSGITASNKSTYDGYATSKQDKIDSTHKLDYSLIDNQPTIPVNTSDLNNNSGFIDSSYHDATKQDKIDENNKLPYSNISGTPTIPNNIVVGSSQSYTIWVGTESDYNSIGTKDSNTLYFIT